jgi:sugar lactone lactonase YvrE
MVEVEHFLPVQNKLGEGPVWSVEEQALYWVDILSNCFHRFQSVTGKHEVFDVGVPISVLALRASGGLVMATKQGFAFWASRHAGLHLLSNPEADRPYMRFNDGAVDRHGRFWAGSMRDDGQVGNKEGVLYRLDLNGSVHVMETGLGEPNGIGWSPDNTRMYFTDSAERTIFVYDFDEVSGEITNRRPFVSATDEASLPDGLTVDSEGFIWSACWEGARIVRYSPDGKVNLTIDLPVLCPTSCVFGGPNLNDLYITTAWCDLSKEQREHYPLSGDIFRVVTNFRGLVKFTFAG